MSLEDAWSQAIRASAKRLWTIYLEGAVLEPPADAKFGDATCNVALRLAKQLRKPPRAIAEELAADLRKAGLPYLAKVLPHSRQRSSLLQSDSARRYVAAGGRLVKMP